MIISKKIISELEQKERKVFSDELKRYLLVKYSQEPFPNEYSEQDLYINVTYDINAYETGELDIALKSPNEYWQEEREYLQNLYIEKCREAFDLEKYVAELEQTLSEHGLKTSPITKTQIEY